MSRTLLCVAGGSRIFTSGVQLAIAVLAFKYFFWAPGAFNAVAAACTAVAAALPDPKLHP
jgi:hypothetical protein